MLFEFNKEKVVEYVLKIPIQVMNKEEGRYEDEETVIVSFAGKKGLAALKRMQDMVFKTFKDASKNSGDKKKDVDDDKVVTAEDLAAMLDMTGESEHLFNLVMGEMKEFATIGGKVRLNEEYQNAMDIEDLDGLYQEVLSHFLLPKICQRLNSLKK